MKNFQILIFIIILLAVYYFLLWVLVYPNDGLIKNWNIELFLSFICGVYG